MKEKVKEIMTRDVITVNENDTVLTVASLLNENKIAGAPVVNDQGAVVGVVSEADVVKLLDNFHWYTPFYNAIDILHSHNEDLRDIKQDIEKASEMLVKDVMTKKPKTVSPDALIDDAAMIMHTTGCNRLPIVDEDDTLVGIVTRADIIASLYDV